METIKFNYIISDPTRAAESSSDAAAAAVCPLPFSETHFLYGFRPGSVLQRGPLYMRSVTCVPARTVSSRPPSRLSSWSRDDDAPNETILLFYTTHAVARLEQTHGQHHIKLNVRARVIATTRNLVPKTVTHAVRAASPFTVHTHYVHAPTIFPA